ncbi:unnamed protein product [Camellia sinensis]
MAMPNLPEEIILDILLRLPITSLGAFRSHGSLFSDRHFIKTHLKLTRNTNDENEHKRFILVSRSCISQSVDFKSFHSRDNFEKESKELVVRGRAPQAWTEACKAKAEAYLSKAKR